MPALANAAEEVMIYLLRTNQEVQDLIQNRMNADQSPIEWQDKTHLVYELQQDFRRRLVHGAESGYRKARFSLWCKDRNRGMTRRLADAVRAALTVNGRQIINEVTVLQVLIVDGERDDSVPASDGKDQPERARTFDCVVHYLASGE